jgi:hypothetical protein
VDYDPVLGLDGAERDLLHHNIQRSCRRTTSLARLGLASRPADSGGQRNRRGPIFSIGFLKPKLFRAGR